MQAALSIQSNGCFFQSPQHTSLADNCVFILNEVPPPSPSPELVSALRIFDLLPPELKMHTIGHIAQVKDICALSIAYPNASINPLGVEIAKHCDVNFVETLLTKGAPRDVVTSFCLTLAIIPTCDLLAHTVVGGRLDNLTWLCELVVSTVKDRGKVKKSHENGKDNYSNDDNNKDDNDSDGQSWTPQRVGSPDPLSDDSTAECDFECFYTTCSHHLALQRALAPQEEKKSHARRGKSHHARSQTGCRYGSRRYGSFSTGRLSSGIAKYKRLDYSQNAGTRCVRGSFENIQIVT